MSRNHRFAHWRRALARLVLLSGCWLVVTGSDPAAWMIGAPAAVLATWVSLRLAPPSRDRLSLAGAARFVPYFLWESLRGGVDIAARVLSPHLPIRPGIRDYQMRLASPSARLLFIDCVSLIPGTLSADLRDDLVRIHVLDLEDDLMPSLAALECRVAALFGEAPRA